ncbi:hypothetical protein Dimus_038417 [Dionaea muscipula]
MSTIATKSTTTSSIIDPSDPLHIHASDNPSPILVAQVLDGAIYTMWKRSMLVSLGAKNKLGCINGTLKAPTKVDPSYLAWQRCKDMVLSWLYNSLSPELANSVLCWCRKEILV